MSATGNVGLLWGTLFLGLFYFFCFHTAPEKVGSCYVDSRGYNNWKKRVLEINSAHVCFLFKSFLLKLFCIL